MKILITGCAGFIGFHLSKSLLNQNVKIYGIDNLNNYYDVKLKKNRLNLLKKKKNFTFSKIDISKKNILENYFKKEKFEKVINLAAQAGVRYSIENPEAYLNSNVIGFYNILELSRKYKVKHLVFASTSSVYGDSNNFPLSEKLNTSKPLNFYAATKISNEAMAYSYSNIYKMKISALRFFTVYGPYGRPDMALFKFTKSILNSKKLFLYNNGKHVRDFTYIDDVVISIKKIVFKPPSTKIPFQLFNIGSNNPQKLKSFIKSIEKALGKKAKIENKPFQPGDIYKTHADISFLKSKIKFVPSTNIDLGIQKFINWYKNYFP